MHVLMYHDVVAEGMEDASGFPGRDAALYKITPEAFDNHLDALSKAAVAPAITFDDGGTSALTAADALERRGWRGSFFVTVDRIGAPGFLDRAAIRELCGRGHAIGSHSCSHPLRMGHLSEKRLLAEWSMSRAALSDVLGQDIRSASVPGGDFSPAVSAAASLAGFRLLFTSEPTKADQQEGALTIRGRFTIRRWTSTATVLALAAGDWVPCMRQALVWRAKKMCKEFGGEGYLELRRLLLRHGREVQWGDKR
jgi:peptidoglycan/xylan/chitin deacetylase (PgdA/CDA1 family)